MIEDPNRNNKSVSKLIEDMVKKAVCLFLGLGLIDISQDFIISATEYKEKFGLDYAIYLLMLTITIASSLIKYRELIKFKPYKQLILITIVLFILGCGIIVFKTQNLAWTYIVYNVKYYVIILLSGSFMAISFELLTALKVKINGIMKKILKID